MGKNMNFLKGLSMFIVSKFVRDLADKIAYNVNNDPIFKSNGIFDRVRRALSLGKFEDATGIIERELVKALKTKIEGYNMDKINPKSITIAKGFEENLKSINGDLLPILKEKNSQAILAKLNEIEDALKAVAKAIY